MPMNYLMFKTRLFKCLGVKYMLKRNSKVLLTQGVGFMGILYMVFF